MIAEDQIESIKRQIFDHIESNFPEEKKSQARAQLEAMTAEELEQFLKKNGLVRGEGSDCIFCSIVSGDVPSHKIFDNEKAVAILEINPVSKGHALILPKEHSTDLPPEAHTLAQEAAKKISELLKPKKVELAESEMFGHKIINVIPIYEKENIHSKREKADEGSLNDLKEKLSKVTIVEEKKPEPDPRISTPKIIIEKDMILPRRIP